jgi:hypothetical protein
LREVALVLAEVGYDRLTKHAAAARALASCPVPGFGRQIMDEVVYPLATAPAARTSKPTSPAAAAIAATT